MNQKPKELRDYLNFLKRRKFHILFSIIVIVLSSVTVASRLPSIYRSTSTILIEAPDISNDLVRSTVSGYADQRIETIKRLIMSRAGLLKIVDQQELYPDLRKKVSMNQVLDKMANDITIELLSSEWSDQKNSRHENAAIAFSVSYEGTSPSTTLEVTEKLTELFLKENLKIRERNVQETTLFLKKEAEKLEIKTEAMEKKIAIFKEKNSGTLPESAKFNLQLLEQSTRDLMDVDQQIRSLEDRRIYLEGQLATIKPILPVQIDGETLIPNKDRLVILRSEYVTLSAKMSPKHPDLLKLKREINLLVNIVGETNVIADLEKRLSGERIQFQRIEEQYGKQHPDVLQSSKIILAIQDEISYQTQIQANPLVIPDNPAYISIAAQVASTKTELASLKVSNKNIRNRRFEITRLLKAAPMVEREFETLIRDRENLSEKYQEIRSKLLGAEVAEGLEAQQKGERFSLVEPPTLPEQPIKPNRPAIVFLGLIFGLAAGLGLGAASEGLDHAIYNANDLKNITGIAPLGVIPMILNQKDHSRVIWKRVGFFVGVPGLLFSVLLAVHFFFFR